MVFECRWWTIGGSLGDYHQVKADSLEEAVQRFANNRKINKPHTASSMEVVQTREFLNDTGLIMERLTLWYRERESRKPMVYLTQMTTDHTIVVKTYSYAGSIVDGVPITEHFARVDVLPGIEHGPGVPALMISAPTHGEAITKLVDTIRARGILNAIRKVNSKKPFVGAV